MSHRLLLFVVLCLAAVAWPSAASAGSYDVWSCWAGSDSFRNPGANGSAWVKSSPNDDRFHAFDECGATDVALGVIARSGYDALSGQHGEVTFSAAPGTQIVALKLWRTAWSYGTGSGSDSHRNYLRILADGADAPSGDNFDGSSDVPHGAAGSTDTANHGLIPANQVNVDLSSRTPSTVSYIVGCGYSTCPTAAPDGGFAAGVTVYGSAVTLRDPSDPEISVAESGLLTGAGPHKGTELVHVTSAKDNTGIKRLAVFYDDATSPVGVVDYERNGDKCAWWRAAPCSNVTDVDVSVDTRRVPDGEHRFVVRAYDSAENVKSWVSSPVTVKNGADAKPDSFGAAVRIDRGAANGLTASDGAHLFAGFARTKRTVLRARFSKWVRLRGGLVDEHGAPIADAEVRVGSRLVPGGPVQQLGVARTDAKGVFTYLVPGHAPSRTIVVDYRSHLGDPDPVASAELGLKVQAGVRLRVKRRHVRNHQAVTFQGRLLGGPVPATGKLIDMQVKIGRRWKTFDTVRARGSNGTFRYRYRFTRTYERITYRFRALARVESGYPYTTGASGVVKVRVN